MSIFQEKSQEEEDFYSRIWQNNNFITEETRRRQRVCLLARRLQLQREMIGYEGKSFAHFVREKFEESTLLTGLDLPVIYSLIKALLSLIELLPDTLEKSHYEQWVITLAQISLTMTEASKIILPNGESVITKAAVSSEATIQL